MAGDELHEADRLAPAPPVPESGVRRLVSLGTVDLGPLRRHRDYRLLFFGQSVSFVGSMITNVALVYQAYAISGSSLVVGLLGAAELAPLLVTAFVGGALADAIDRRRMVMLAELGLALSSGVLVANSLQASPQLWLIFVVAAVAAALQGLQRPSLSALTPRLVPREEMAAASALNSMRRTFGLIAGPSIGGVLIASVGLAWTYGVDVVSFVFSLAMLALMRATPPPVDAERPSLRSIVEGFRYARSREELVGTYAVDMVAMFFGMPSALFPAYAQRFGGPGVLGLLFAAPSAGAFVATLTSGWVSRVQRHGLAVILAATVWGVGITAFGLAPALWVALVALAVAGWADMVSGIFRNTIWNQTIPDRLRGRLAGIEQISYSSGPLLGNVEAGVVASLTSVRTSIVSGGLLCIAGVAVTAAMLPAFRRYDARRAILKP